MNEITAELFNKDIVLHPIGHVISSFKVSQHRTLEEFAVLESDIVLKPEFSNGLDGLLEKYKSAFVIFFFDRNLEKDHLTVRPIRDATRPLCGVFATRSPSRPNHIGMTSVELISRTGPNSIHVRGLDALDGTPIIDIKPNERRT